MRVKYLNQTLKMKTKYSPKVAHIDITNNCNLNCLHCRVLDNHKETNVLYNLNFEDIKKLLMQLKKWGSIEWISIGGGEPLLRKDLFDIISLSKKLGFKTLLVTNGTLVDKNIVEKLEKAELNRVQISIDGMKKTTHEKIRGKNTFDMAVNSVNYFLKSKIETTIRMVITKINYKETEDFIKYFASKGVPSISIRRFVPVGNSSKNFKELYLDSKVYYNILKKAILIGEKLNVKIASGDPLLSIVKTDLKKIDIEGYIGGCTPGITYLYISYDGKIKPCPMLDISLGDIKKDNIRKIWENSDFYKKIRNREISGKCGECKYKWICGGCRANALYLNKNLWEEDPLCWRIKK